MRESDESAAKERSEFLGALRKGVLIGLAALVVILPPVIMHRRHSAPPPAFAQKGASPHSPAHVARFASFGTQKPSVDVSRVANWVADSRDNGARSFVVLDKKSARVWVFDPQARLIESTPAVLGAAHGDDTAPGVADKPLDQVKFEERTTPAGRFIAEVGQSSSRGEDVVWVDYDAAVSMHRVINAPERLKALQTPEPDDNRLSFGCINLPRQFYEGVLRPTMDRTGAVVYVIPETRQIRDTFANYYDVDAPMRLAQH